MTNDLIRRSALLKDLEYDPAKRAIVQPQSTFGIILSAPAVDAVEVVRCVECRFNVNNMEADPLCLNDYTGADIVCAYWESDGLAAEDFCSHGERRSE